jgi:predicted transcriptional regulator
MRHTSEFGRRLVEWVGKLVEQVCEAYDVITPVDLDKLLKQLNGKCEYVALLTSSKFSIRKTAADAFIISVPTFYPKRRQRFLIARSLGHLFMRMGYAMENDTRWDETKIGSGISRYGTVQEECATYYFAMELLMPEAEFKNVCKKYTELDKTYVKVCDLHKVADHFQVTFDNAYHRGKTLHLFK